MVRTRVNSNASILRDCTKQALKIFGKTLTIEYVTRTLDQFGKLTAVSSTTTTFLGDLQYGPDLDQRYVQTGIVEIGEGVLYMQANELSTNPSPGDIVQDGNERWEIVEGIDAPQMGGATTFLQFRCRRRINSSD